MNKKILVIPGAFVPYNDTVTLLSYKHLRGIEAEKDVIALRGKEDPGLLEKLKNDKKFKTFNIEYFLDYDKTVATFEKKNVISGFFNIIRYCLYARKRAKSKEYGVVYTSSVPSFTHLSGYLIKKMLKKDIVWVASFSDPLYKSPYKKDPESFKEYSLLKKIGFYIYIWIYMNGFYEKIAQKYADKIIYICKQQRDFMVSNYKNKDELLKKAMIIPLNYIEEWHIQTNNKISDDNMKIVAHFGRIYGLRKIDTILEALYELKQEINNLSDLIVFKQYGEILDRYKKKINDYGLKDIFKYYDKISYNQVLEEMEKSHVLALYDTLIEGGIQPYLPSKSLEYLLLKKDLFILTQKDSPTYDLFSKYGYKCTSNNKDEVKARIKEIIFTKSSQKDFDISEYKNSVAAKDLKEYIEGVINK